MSSTCLVSGTTPLFGTTALLDHWASPNICLWRICFGKSYAEHFLHRLVRDGVRLGLVGVLRSDLDPNLGLHFWLHPESWLVYSHRVGLQMDLLPMQEECYSTWKCLQAEQFNWPREKSGRARNWKQVFTTFKVYGKKTKELLENIGGLKLQTAFEISAPKVLATVLSTSSNSPFALTFSKKSSCIASSSPSTSSSWPWSHLVTLESSRTKVITRQTTKSSPGLSRAATTSSAGSPSPST